MVPSLAPPVARTFAAQLAALGALAACLVALGGGVDLSRDAAPDPLEARLAALDLPAAQRSVERQRARLERESGAWTPGRASTVASFTALAAKASGLTLVGLDAHDPRYEGLLGTMWTEVEVEGHVYDLLPFVEALSHSRVVGVPVGLAVRARPGGQARMTLVLEYATPNLPDKAWIADRLALAEPAAQQAAPILGEAAQLSAWRTFAAAEPARILRRAQASDHMSRTLAASLVRLRKNGGTARWTEPSS